MRFFLCFVLASLLVLGGCSAPDIDPSAFSQSYPCTLSLEGKMGGVPCSLTVQMQTAGRGTLVFSAPVEVAGLQFVVHSLPQADPEDDILQYAERGVTVLMGDLTIPLSEGTQPATIYGVIQAFSTTNDALKTVERKGDDSLLTYGYPDGYVTLTVTKDGLPTHLYIDLYGAISELSIKSITYEENTL